MASLYLSLKIVGATIFAKYTSLIKCNDFLLAVLHPCRASRRPTRCSDTPDRSSRVSASRWTMIVTTARYIPAPPVTIRPNSQCPITSNSSSRNSSILTIIRSTIRSSKPRRIIIKVISLRNRRPLRQQRSRRTIDRIHPTVWLSPCPTWFTEHRQPSPASLLP